MESMRDGCIRKGKKGTFVEQLKAQYELQCEKDNTDDKKELLEAKRRMMDLDDLI